jgi:lipopolysaccharide transport system ATP-binding protein
MQMPDEFAIRVEGLGKMYTIGGPQEQYLTIRDAIMHSVKKPFHRFLQKNSFQSGNEFWALKEVSFEIPRGEAIGIIGRNGAGKSTLLKILSRITTPSEGTVELHGRVGSLLEVGTGFHPEMTGRENIFLNGSILGMKKSEIEQKFDEIVKFSEIEKFLDTPVKRYSSGMYVRLAFAVAAHMDTEILLIDEVLAVGDSAFQKKCLGKMGDVATKEGRTVLFVSHNMAAVSNLCEKSILLNCGRITSYDSTNKIIDEYLKFTVPNEEKPLLNRIDRSGDGRLRITETWIENERGERVTNVQSGDNIKITATFEKKVDIDLSNLSIAFALSNTFFQLSDLSNEISGEIFPGKIPHKGRIECYLPRLPLNSGLYFYNIIARTNNGIEDWIQRAGSFTVESADYYGTGRIVDTNQGSYLFNQKWKLIDMGLESVNQMN